jgi:arylformamidase
MKIFLSYVLDENTPTYGDRDKFTITQKSQIVNGVGANTSTWSFSNNHMGTHMDTPYHFIESGKRTIDYSAEDFCFDNISIIEKKCDKGDLISLSLEEINSIPKNTDFLIIKTGYCKFRLTDKYHNDNPGLESNLADILKEKLPNLKGVGFDFISLTSWNHRAHGRLSHRSFLGEPNNFLVIEDMDLLEINNLTILNSLVIAPLRTIDGNGGPVTIIADIHEK